MQKEGKTLQEKRKKVKKNDCLLAVGHFSCVFLLGGLDGNLAENLEVLHKLKGSFAGAGTSSFVTFDNLCFGVLGELGILCSDLFNKLFHVMIGFIV